MRADAGRKPARNHSTATWKATTAQKLRARDDEKGAIKAEGEARQLQSMAGAGGRYDQENAITKGGLKVYGNADEKISPYLKKYGTPQPEKK
jgi:hypothetical protein